MTLGREDYNERIEARRERAEQLAEKREAEASQRFRYVDSMLGAMNGTPILVGHHSEKRHHKALQKVDDNMRKGVEASKAAKYWERRAKEIGNGRAISSDDPEVIAKLKARLAQKEALQDRMRTVNAAWRKAKKPDADNQAGWERMAEIIGCEVSDLWNEREGIRHQASYHVGDPPYFSWKLSNNNAGIRRLATRLSDLEREAAARARVAEAMEEERDEGFCTVVENLELNRLQLFFPGKPSEAVRKILKQAGFRWARSEGAWQRLLNVNARCSAKYAIGRIKALESEAAGGAS